MQICKNDKAFSKCLNALPLAFLDKEGFNFVLL